MHRKRLRIVVAVAFVLVGLLAAGCSTGNPQIELPQTEHDFGEVVWFNKEPA